VAHRCSAARGLTRNDAFLNLQADGTERKSQAVTSIRNADGSRTYLVDLAGIPAGTAVNLAFDLIGFGKGAAAASSHLTIRDLRIGVPQAKDDSATLAEDRVATIAALANDLNAQQPGFAPIIVDAPVHGQITINADGTFSFAPEKDWHGEDHFSYKLSDGHVDSNLAIVSLTVTPVNDAPVAAHDAANVGEDGTLAVSGNLLANDSDVDTGTVLTVAAPGVYVGAYGTLTLSEDGSYSYALANDSSIVQALRAGEIVSDVFAYAATDGIASTPATLTVTITGTNDGPVTTDDAASVGEDTMLAASGNLLANDSDVDAPKEVPLGDTGTVLTVAAPGDYAGTYGTLTLAEDGSYSYPLANDSAIVQALREGEIVSDVFAYAATDGITSTPATLTVTITGANDGPVTGNDVANVGEDGTLAASGNLLANDSDVDTGTVLTITAPGDYVGTYGTLTLSQDGSYSYALVNDSAIVQALRAGEIVTDAFAYAATDGIATTPATLTVSITGANDGPVTTNDTANVSEDGTLAASGNLLANDSDVDAPKEVPLGDTDTVLTVAETKSYTGAYGTLTVNGDGWYSYTLANESPAVQGLRAGQVVADVFVYEATDGITATPATLTIQINGTNDGPQAQGDAGQAREDGGPVAFAADALLANDRDADLGDSKTLVAVSNSAAGARVSLIDGQVVYDVASLFQSLKEGETASDSFSYTMVDGEGATSTAFVSMTIVGANDIAVARDDAATLAEDGRVTLAVMDNDSDVDGDALTLRIVTPPAHGTLTLNADDTVTYMPAGDYNGEDAFAYVINDGLADSNLASVHLVIQAVNDAAVAADASVTLDEDTTSRIDPVALATDIDSTTLSAHLVAGPQHGPHHGQVTLNADGSFSYTPEANYHGSDSFSYLINDGEMDSNIATVSLSIAAVNDAPVASPDSNPLAATLLEDGSITLNLLAGASDVDGDALSLRVGAAQHGSLTRNADGSYTYVPQADFNGEDGFTYSVSDGQLDSAPAMVRLTITAVNDAPVAQDAAATLNEDGRVTLALMNQASDVDGDALSLRIVDQPAHGSLILNADNTVSYVPAQDWSGEDVFSYLVNDGQADSNIATVRLTVAAVADAPTLVITDLAGQGRELFRTGWESVRDKNSTSTLVEERELEGWKLITRPDPSCGGSNGFEVWSSGDRMMDAGNKLRIVNSGTGNGDNWLELNNAGGHMHQTLGIERSFETVAGASYTLSLDLAGRMGFSADYTRVGILVDGVRIGGDASTSPGVTLDWQTRSFQFTGSGGKQTIRIVSEATRWDKNGRGMMIDDIALTETLAANTGREDSAIPLSAISAGLTDTDGSEALAISIEALPVGATVTDGTRRFTATADATTADVTGWNLGNLYLIPPQHFNGSLSLRVVATATESASEATPASQARTTADLVVTVLAVNDAPLAQNATYLMEEGGQVRIDFSSLVSDVDGNVLSLALGKPKHGSLLKNADGSYTYTPKRGFDGTESFSYTVSDGTLSATATITLMVREKDDDDDEDDHHGGHCARVVVQSGCGVGHDDAPGQSGGPSFTLDWHGCAPNAGKSVDDGWARDYFVPPPQQKSLAELTGLVVRLKK
jgi:VCBS repeat-containing protein